MAFTDGQVVTASQLNAANVKASQGPAGATGTYTPSVTLIQINGTGASVTVPTGGSVKLTICLPDISNTSNGYTQSYTYVRRGGTGTGTPCVFNQAEVRGGRSMSFVDSPSAGTYTYDLGHQEAVASGSYNHNIGPYLIAEVFGPP